MKTKIRSCLLSLAILGTAVAASGDSSVGAQDHSDDAATIPAPTAEPARTAAASCAKQCDVAEAMCSSEVRRARQQCSKNAANSGRDPFTMRNEYAYFCGYFNSGAYCGAGSACRDRLAHTYGLCIDAVQQNIASMRYDCYLNERTAQAYCRDELRDCKATCQ
jgi:hypothetical protein